MASEEHKKLASYLKQVHSSLRIASAKVGDQQAWIDHCLNKQTLSTYAECMQKLATTHWAENCHDDNIEATSRIDWAAQLCLEYFENETYLKFRERDIDIANKLGTTLVEQESFSKPIKLIDIGSCYNPFSVYDFLDVLAIDLCPANNKVLQCDFLQVLIGTEHIIEDNKVVQLQEQSFDVVTFCFLLEYLPSSTLRVAACEKAYSLLKPGGILIISTPDSKHVGANSKLMKCWRYTMAIMGFSRIKYEKLKHMHCMAFRRSLKKDIASRWATIHKESYMDYVINIPQDFQEQKDEFSESEKTVVNVDEFNELPFCEDLSDC